MSTGLSRIVGISQSRDPSVTFLYDGANVPTRTDALRSGLRVERNESAVDKSYCLTSAQGTMLGTETDFDAGQFRGIFSDCRLIMLHKMNLFQRKGTTFATLNLARRQLVVNHKSFVFIIGIYKFLHVASENGNNVKFIFLQMTTRLFTLTDQG